MNQAQYSWHAVVAQPVFRLAEYAREVWCFTDVKSGSTEGKPAARWGLWVPHQMWRGRWVRWESAGRGLSVLTEDWELVSGGFLAASAVRGVENCPSAPRLSSLSSVVDICVKDSVSGAL